MSAGWFVIVLCSVKLSGSSIAVEVGRCMVLGSSSYSKFMVVVLVIDCALVVAGVDCMYLVWGQARSRWGTFASCPYVPPGLTLKNSTRCSLCVECFVWTSKQTATFPLYVIN